MIAQIQMRRGTTAEWAAASPVVLAAGEPGYDTTIRKTKIGDGTTEWASLPWLNGDVPNPNILHNWDWRNNPVNQRSVSGTITSAGYFYDRWFAYAAGSLTINSGYVACTKNIEQRIEGLGLAGKVATFSMMVDNVVYAKTLTFPSTTGSVSSGTDMPTAIIFAHDTTDMRVRINGLSTGLNYQAFKLELGTVSTLHLDPPMDWAVELPKCYRFFYNTTVRIPGRCKSATTVYAYLPLPASMRVAPTSNSTSGTVHSSTGAVGFSSIAFNLREGGLGVTASGASGLTTGDAAVVEFSAQLSADL